MKNALPITLFLAFIFSNCQQTKINSPIDLAKQELTEFAKSQKINTAFNVKTAEIDSVLTLSMVNKAIGRQISLKARRDTTILIGLYSIKAKNSAKSEIFTTNLVKRGALVSLEISDLTGKVIEKINSPAPDDNFPPTENPPTGGFKSFQDCLDAFYCSPQYCELVDRANRTCETVYTGLLCCLENGTCAWFDFISINPTDPNCRFKVFLADVPLTVRF